MAGYTPKERINNAFEHKASDRVPIDFGSTGNTSITIDAYENLKRYLKIDLPTRTMSKNLSLAFVDEVVLERFGVDTRGVFLSGTDIQSSVELSADTYIDEWGITYYKPPYSPFYDTVKNPLAGEITSKTLKEYPWPDPHKKGRVRDVRERARFLREHTDYAVVLHVMGGFITQSQYLRGLEQWLMDLAGEPDLLGELLDYTLGYQLELAMDALSECNFDVDIVHFGDDLGMQTGPLFSPQSYREVIKPRQAKLFGEMKAHSKAKVLLHSCGSNHDFMDDLIEIGMDALNPVQTNAKNMTPEILKRDFGSRMTFWGGIDTHAKRGMKEEVTKVLDVMAADGGYVLNTIHNIQPNIAPEAVCAIFDTALNYGRQ